MDDSKKLQIGEILLFAFLVIFPFGQLFSFWNISANFRIPIHLLELIIGGSFVFLLFAKFKQPRNYSAFKNFGWLILFSFVLSLFTFKSTQALVGSLYLLRLWLFFGFFVLAWNLARRGDEKKKLIINSLIAVSFFAGLFGWWQYFFYPDMRFLVLVGWDDHLYRMIGTFLDPTFTGLILVFGFLLSFISFSSLKNRWLNFLIPVFFLLSLAFTYSRASYLALFSSAIYLAVSLKRQRKQLLVFLLIFIGVVVSLPRPSSEGVELERTQSITAKIADYKDTLQIINKNPLWGVGYNNLCLAKKVYLGEKDLNSHSCSGADSSLLLLLSTTGVLGLIAFLNLLTKTVKNISKQSISGKSFLACLIALLVHSQFANSLFYPWILGFMLLLLATATPDEPLRRKI